MLKKKLKHTCAHKSLLSIYIIYNYIIYRFVSRILHFKNYTYLSCLCLYRISVRVIYGLHYSQSNFDITKFVRVIYINTLDNNNIYLKP